MAKLRAFVRISSTGTVVGGSLILRKNKPVNGRWMEITPEPCCTTTLP